MSDDKDAPKDIKFMKAVLKEMGITNYETKITNLMLDFCYS